MSKKPKSSSHATRRSPVARHAHKVNRSLVFLDRTCYKRQAKHRRWESFPMVAVTIAGWIGKGFGTQSATWSEGYCEIMVG
jgi:hypothetical protein